MDSNQTNFEEPVKTGPTGLSITSLVFAFLCPPVGFILSIIDLIRKHGRKKFLSVIALIVSCVIGLVAIVVAVILFGVMAPQVAKYTEKSNVASDMQLCDSVKYAITTSMLDPAVINSDNAGIPAEDQWIYVEDIDTSTDFGHNFEELMGAKPYEIEQMMIKSSYMGTKANGMRFMITGANTVIVEIENSDSTGNKGRDYSNSPISTDSYSYYSY